MSRLLSTAGAGLRVAAGAAPLLLSSCAAVVSFDDLPVEERALRGTVSGLELEGATVSLELSALRFEGSNLRERSRRAVVGNGAFDFPAILPYGGAYLLSIAGQPAGHHCSIRGGEGKVAGYDIMGVEVRCKRT